MPLSWVTCARLALVIVPLTVVACAHTQVAVAPAAASSPAVPLPAPSAQPAPAGEQVHVRTSAPSPEVLADGRVTFRLRAPAAALVTLALEGAPAAPMHRDDDGAWTITTAPLEPDYYGYSFVADDVAVLDPRNGSLKPNLLATQNVVHVPGPAALPWEASDVPHGVVHRHFYRSAVVGDDRDFYVYTPPGYDAAPSAAYPVLYLLHGFSDDAGAWVSVGRANVVLDNLIAQGKVTPMIVVMPLGYGAPEILAGGFAGFARDRGLLLRNFDRFRDSLVTEVVPRVEAAYRVVADRRSRAIAGLSMGGAESLYVGLNDVDRFAWVGSFSAGGLAESFGETFPRFDRPASKRLELLFVACGKDDHLVGMHRKLHDWLAARGAAHVNLETPGAHTWMVWRRNLAALAQLLFRP
jgi:enterochelin esterase-like enzyme